MALAKPRCKTYFRIPYGQERLWQQEGVPVPTTPCRDCGVALGKIHKTHCCIEACSICLDGQAVTCALEGCKPESLN